MRVLSPGATSGRQPSTFNGYCAQVVVFGSRDVDYHIAVDGLQVLTLDPDRKAAAAAPSFP